MKKAVLEAEVLPCLLAGTGRMALPRSAPGMAKDDGKTSLKALSLTGQSLRFGRPASPAKFAVPVSIDDERAIIPEALRRPLLRLFASKPVTEHPALALAHAFDRLRLRPHPFDLPRLDGFVRSYAEQLGAVAQHWANRQKETSEPAFYFDRETLDDTNWTQATPARRAAYLERRRRDDAAAARALLESTWATERAEVRARLLRALETGLSADDQPFLTTLAKDRAPTVRALSQRMLSRLGLGDENPALRAALERIKRTDTGLLRKRAILTLELPATVKEQTAARWVRDTFSEVGFGELAKALALSEADLIAASAKDVHMALALALLATGDRRIDLLPSIVDSLSNAWELLAASGLDDLGLMSHDERSRWAEIVARPYGAKLPDDYMAWNWLHRVLDGPAAPSLIDIVLKTDWLERLPGIEKQGRYWMEIIAALCPPKQRSALRARLNSFDSAITSTAILLLDILEPMETTRTHA